MTGDFSSRGLGIKGDFGTISFTEYGYTFNSAIKKVYFFAPAQHYLNNRKYSMEVTILMADTPNDYYAVALTLLFRTGSSNPFFDYIISYLSKSTNPKVNLDSLIPNSIQNFYTYEGSLPVPPCNEKMKWYIYPSVQTLSSSQLSFFTKHWAGNVTFAGGRGNARLVQSLNGRDILYHRSI
jgi:carbonic anhydrase